MLRSSRLIGITERYFVRRVNEALIGSSAGRKSKIRGELSKLSSGAKTASIVKIALAACEAKLARRVNCCCKPKSFTKRSKKLVPYYSEEGRREYQQRAGIEGTLSQGIRRGTVRRSRYVGLQKTHLQEVARAAGINILRSINFLHDKPTTKTRVSRFARLAN